MTHRIQLKSPDGLSTGTVFYDPRLSSLTWANGEPVTLTTPDRPLMAAPFAPEAIPVNGPELPGRKSHALTTINIQLGLKCNYSCSYCLQRHQPDAPETHADDVDSFLAKMGEWFDGGKDGSGKGATIRFWGGEPFSYWKKLRPLGIALSQRYPSASFVIITNGSVLTPIIIDWLDACGIGIAISHDGPGQPQRGPDPFEDPKRRENILLAYDRLHPKGKISFNAVLTRENHDLAIIYDWFKERLGDRPLSLSSEGMVLPYHEEGKTVTPSWTEAGAISSTIASNIIGGKGLAFGNVRQKLEDFHQSLVDGRRASSLGQKCGMDRPDKIAVSLSGEVLTCHNASTTGVAGNGRSHVIGHVDRFDDIRLDTATSWQFRENCSKCPVLQLCKGNCMFLQEDTFQAACVAEKTFNTAILAAAIYFLTGMLPERIETLSD